MLSKFGCVVQERRNHVTGEMKTKRRIIVDTKQSRVKHGTQCGHRSALPQVTDAVFGALEQMLDAKAGEGLEWLIADFKDAFWLIPSRASERRYFVGRLLGRYLVYLRTAQGPSGAPIS